MKNILLGILYALSLGVLVSPIVSAATVPAAVVYQPLLKPGEKVQLDADHWFIYGFASPPKLGTVIMRVEIFTRDNVRDTSFVVKGDADMPSMRGAHSTGDTAFSLSAKGVYLLPIRLVMPGEWEVRLTFEKGAKTMFRGTYLFDI